MIREEAVKWLSNLKNDLGQMQYQPLWHYAEAIDGIIETLQTDIVHCEECKHYDEGRFCWHPAAELGDTLATEPTDSCSYGERREE